MYKALSQIIKSPERLEILKDRLSIATKIGTTLEDATGQNIWIIETDKVVQKRFKEFAGKLKVATSESDYQRRLTALFIKLSCENTFVATRVIKGLEDNTRLLKTHFAQCLLSLNDKTNPTGQFVCPGVSKSSKEVLDELKRIASVKDPENKIKSTFKCGTGVSD